MSQVTLAIRHLQDEQISLREAGLYWVALDQPADANLIACQFLSSLQQTHAATLTCCGQDPATVIASMASDAGPGALRLFSVPDDAAIRAAFNAFTSDLSRINVRQGSYLVLMLAASPVENLSRDQLHRWIDGMRQWLDEQACTLLVLCHGQAPALHERLLAFNEDISGLAQLYRRDGGICYQLNFWHSDKGVCAAQAFDLVLENDVFGLSVTQLSSPPQTRTDDQRIYLTQRSVLEGAPPLSEQWRLFEHRDELLEQAGHARAASVIMALESNQEVELLARRLHGLRERCGVGLKVIVREMEPCLRYRDERLLLACGANLIVPFKTPLAHFLSLVDSVQGQTWRHRQVANVRNAVRSPPTSCATWLAGPLGVHHYAGPDLRQRIGRGHPPTAAVTSARRPGHRPIPEPDHLAPFRRHRLRARRVLLSVSVRLPGRWTGACTGQYLPFAVARYFQRDHPAVDSR